MKYKLIKEYPGSPKLNTIFDYWTDGISEQVYNKNSNPSFISLKIAKDYSEFWEKIVEKDYEILSFNNKKEKILIKGKDYLAGIAEQILLDSKINEIHSVKRLSDGEVFTINDKIEVENKGIIVKFEIDDLSNSGMTVYSDKNITTIYNNSCLSHIQKYNNALFTTEDGVNIKVGDTYWVLNTKFNDWIFEEKAARDNINYFYKDKSYAEKTRIYYFSTKEAAEEYVLMNKPCLSINAVLSINQWNLVETKTSTTKKLKELVKLKLK